MIVIPNQSGGEQKTERFCTPIKKAAFLRNEENRRFSGGGLGIRTLGRLITDTKFRVSHLRPLGQPSNIYLQHQVSETPRKKERTDGENYGIKFSDLTCQNKSNQWFMLLCYHIDTTHFECGPFSHLGTSPYLPYFTTNSKKRHTNPLICEPPVKHPDQRVKTPPKRPTHPHLPPESSETRIQ